MSTRLVSLAQTRLDACKQIRRTHRRTLLVCHRLVTVLGRAAAHRETDRRRGPSGARSNTARCVFTVIRNRNTGRISKKNIPCWARRRIRADHAFSGIRLRQQTFEINQNTPVCRRVPLVNGREEKTTRRPVFTCVLRTCRIPTADVPDVLYYLSRGLRAS